MEREREREQREKGAYITKLLLVLFMSTYCYTMLYHNSGHFCLQEFCVQNSYSPG